MIAWCDNRSDDSRIISLIGGFCTTRRGGLTPEGTTVPVRSVASGRSGMAGTAGVTGVETAGGVATAATPTSKPLFRTHSS